MKKLVSALCWVLLLTASSHINAQNQTVNPTTGQVQTTGNLINPTGWNNITYTNSAGVSNCCQGGPMPAMNQDTNTIRFSWAQYPVYQIIAVNDALANAGTNVQINGFNYSFQLNNDLNNFGGTRGTLMANAVLATQNGGIVQNWMQDYSSVNTGGNFVTEAGTVNFGTSYALNTVQFFGVAFIGKDMNYWAGYYGPRVRDPEVSLNYTAGPVTPPTDRKSTRLNSSH